MAISRAIEGLEHKVEKSLKYINDHKPHIDRVIDPLLVYTASNAGMAYGLFKIAESELSDSTKGLLLAGYGIGMYFANKYPVRKFAHYLKEKAKFRVRLSQKGKPLSWARTGLLLTALAVSSPYVAEKIDDVVYEIRRPLAERIHINKVATQDLQDYLNNLRLAKKNSTTGRIERTERWKYATDDLEAKYGMPDLTLYSVIMQESYGDPLQINTSDGGAGVVHTQPSTGKLMGLKIYQDCNKLVSKDHADSLTQLIQRVNYNLDSLGNYDDRFNMKLLLTKHAEELKAQRDRLGSWDAAVATIRCGPNGALDDKGHLTRKAKKYLGKLNQWRSQRDNYRFMEKVQKDFNRRNPGFNFKSYIRYFRS